MNPMWIKAGEAARSAHVLCDVGLYGDAVSRAYNAMFSAARAALREIDGELDKAKTHATLIRRFGSHVVVGRGLESSIGSLLPQVEDVRITADYGEVPMTERACKQTIDEMDRFLEAVAVLFDFGRPTP
jgi:uncharacterized protein (UPF0332 family)